MKGWKVTTHDLRPPVRGGEPIWDGTVPAVLPERELDTGAKECAAGWNFCLEPHTAFKIAGLWPTGRPSRLWRVDGGDHAIQRGDKCRTGSLLIEREATAGEIEAAIAAFSTVFAPHAETMCQEQLAWRAAFARRKWA